MSLRASTCPLPHILFTSANLALRPPQYESVYASFPSRFRLFVRLSTFPSLLATSPIATIFHGPFFVAPRAFQISGDAFAAHGACSGVVCALASLASSEFSDPVLIFVSQSNCPCDVMSRQRSLSAVPVLPTCMRFLVAIYVFIGLKPV